MTARSRPPPLPQRGAAHAIIVVLGMAATPVAHAQQAPPRPVTVVPSACGVEPVPLEAFRGALQVELGGGSVVSIGASETGTPHTEVRLEPSPCVVDATSVSVSIRLPDDAAPHESSFSLDGTPRGARLRVIALVVAERLRQVDADAHGPHEPRDEPPLPASPAPLASSSPPPAASSPPPSVPRLIAVVPPPHRAPSLPHLALGMDLVVRDYASPVSSSSPLPGGSIRGPIVFFGPRAHLTFTHGFLFLRAGLDGLFTDETLAIGHASAGLLLGSAGVGLQFRGARFAVAPWLRAEGGIGGAWGSSAYANVTGSSTSGALLGASLEVPMSIRVTRALWVSLAPAIGLGFVGISAYVVSVNAAPTGLSTVGPFYAASLGITYDL